jgi:hypothetical protein
MILPLLHTLDCAIHVLGYCAVLAVLAACVSAALARSPWWCGLVVSSGPLRVVLVGRWRAVIWPLWLAVRGWR